MTQQAGNACLAHGRPPRPTWPGTTLLGLGTEKWLVHSANCTALVSRTASSSVLCPPNGHPGPCSQALAPETVQRKLKRQRPPGLAWALPSLPHDQLPALRD